MQDFNWLIRKTPRTVKNLKLWPENPRLNPEESHSSIKEYAEDLTYDNADKEDFKKLVNSIVTDGFIPADPVVVWKNDEDNKYYVAEGNRRIVALKLLLEPRKAPRSIRSFIRDSSAKVDLASIEKVPVNVAPSFDDAEWYINQRNSSSTLQRKWSRIQQHRWISKLYSKYDGDIEQIVSVTKLSKSDLESFIRILKIKDFILIESVKNKLTDEEFETANSYKFPISILERFFNFSEVKEKWGINYDGIEVQILSSNESFFTAFAELIKKIVSKSDENINTRILASDIEAILANLPQVVFPEDDTTDTEDSSGSDSDEIEDEDAPEDETGDEDVPEDEDDTSNPYEHLKGDPNRNKIILPIYFLNTDDYRLAGLFDELKRIPFSYKNSVSASLRVFLDLAVRNFISTEGLESDIAAAYGTEFRNVTLKVRLEYIKSNKLTGRQRIVASRLLDTGHQYSLDVLNGYIHGTDTHYLNKQFLNGFWDFLFPLFENILDIREENA